MPATRTSRCRATAATTCGHYGLDLRYTPATRRLDGTAAIVATATQDLSRFDLDLRGFTVRSVTVNARRASFTRAGQELKITPAHAAAQGRGRSSSPSRYGGVPRVITDPDDSIEGFVPTNDGAFVVGEPQGSPGWFPSNDTPNDKATYTIRITVPAGLTAVGNGRLLSQRTARRADHVRLERVQADGDLPGHGHAGQVPGAPGQRRAASRSTSRSTRRRPRRPSR